MNQTKSINIGGVFFVINEDAYETLSVYISALEKKYLNTEDGKEIVQDIEARIAELFTKRLANNRNVVQADDVNYAIQTLGKPEEFENFDAEEANTASKTENNQKNFEQENVNTEKRYYRNPDDKVIMGVCSGLSAYLGIADPIWLRLITLGLAFLIPGLSTGTVFLAYLILAILVPEAKTTSQKLQMRGKAVNLDNIEKKISGAYNSENKTAVGNFFNRIGEILSQLVGVISPIFLILLKIIAVIFVIIGLIFVGSFFVGIMATIPFLHQAQIFTGFNNYLFSGSVFLSLGLPFIISILGLGAWLLKTKLNKSIWWTLFIACVVSWILMFYYLTNAVKGFSNQAKVQEKITLNDIKGDTLYIAKLDNPDFGNNKIGLQFDKVKYNFVRIYNNTARLDVKKNTDNSFELLVKKSSRGENEKQANSFTKGLKPEYKLSGDTLYISSTFAIDKNTPWRYQDMDYTLLLPEGKSIHLTESAEDVVYDIKNVTNTLDEYMIGKTWKMEPKGLTCIACNLPSHTSLNGDDEDENFSSSSDNNNQLNVQDFNKINVRGAFNIQIEESDDYSVNYNMDKQWENIVNIKTEGNELIISMNENKNKSINVKDIAKIKIKMPQLKRIVSKGLNNIEINDFNNEDDLEISAEGGSNIEINGDYSNLQINTDGASRLKLRGSCNTGEIESNGASVVDADRMEFEKLKINLAGTVKADVFVSQSLNANLEGITVLNYKGNPDRESIKKSATSIVNKEN